MPWSVLVVDDDPSTRRVLSCLIEMDEQLRLDGTASNGSEGIDHVGGRCPDAIVCDLEMPILSGAQAVPRLRATCPHAVIVVYSAHPTAADTELRDLADAVHDKAAGPAGLLEEVVRLCKKRLKPPPTGTVAR
jgi:two-component system, chemotaxis family, protein-glutamate methylesterase/glutaminase